MRTFHVVLVMLVLTSCGTTVAIDFDQEVDFSSLTTYDYYPDIESGLSDLDNKRMMYALDSLMLERGLKRTESPQILVNFFAKESISNARNTIGIGIGGGGGNVGVGVSGGIPIGGTIVNQQLTIDFIDASRDALIWQAVADGEYREKATPVQKERYYAALVAKILKKYPPRKK